MTNCRSNPTGYMVISGGEPLALIRPEGGGSVLGFAADADAATIFTSTEEADAAIARTPHPERLQAMIVALIPSSITLEAEPEIPDDAATLAPPTAAAVQTTADNGGRSSR